MIYATVIISFIINLINSPLVSSSWWSLGIPTSHKEILEIKPTSAKAHCRGLSSLEDNQKQLCELNHHILQAISKGAKLGIDECQHQFRRNRWNCTTFDDHPKIFGSVVESRSREKAYIYAISAAGLSYTVTKACSQSLLANCSCDNGIRSKTTKGKWNWGGCSDDIQYGSLFSRSFLDSLEDNSTADGLMNLHNNEAGRSILKSKMERVCKCHGVSGSCTMRVCWRKLGSFRGIGDELMKRFDGATKVRLVARKTKPRLKPITKEIKKPSRRDLVFLEPSLNYCERNETLKILGTQGRRCNATSLDTDSCKLLCCGRGYHTMVRSVQDKCNCKFIWCCRVDCQKCMVQKEEHFCN